MELPDIERLFTRSDGTFLFSRWGRPIVPVVFGVEDATLGVIKGAIEAVVFMAGHKMSDTDPELGANLLVFFFREWDELAETPDLDRLVPDFDPLLQRLKEADANQYRLYRFDEAGAIKAVFAFIRLGPDLAAVPAEDLALAEAAQVMLLWSDTAFTKAGPLGTAREQVVLRPDIASVLKAAYDPVLPQMSEDKSHALRLLARLTKPS